MVGVLVDPVRISRGLLSSPSIGSVLLPQDLLIFVGPLFLGFVLHLDFLVVLIFFVVSFALLLHLRRRGEGYLRGVVLFFSAPKRHLPAVPDPFRREIFLKGQEFSEIQGGKSGASDPFSVKLLK